MTTLADALDQARTFWEAKGPSSRMMSIRAQACASALGHNAAKARKVDGLGPADGMKVLTHLRTVKKLSKGSIAAYYAAFRRAVELGGGDCRAWPKADTPPRRCREPLSEADLDRLEAELRGPVSRYSREHWTEFSVRTRYGMDIRSEDKEGWWVGCGGWETWDLLELLRGTGMRVDVEALNWEASTWDPERKVLKVRGKGGHERLIPVARPETIALLNSPGRLKAMRRLRYSGHLKRWQQAVERLRIASMKPTPHAVRHYYATRAYDRSGKNIKIVQELLGHADISTTARYLGVDMEEMRHAVG